ncbi:hypothetical protein RJ55_02815 [Drechmeria coniospora]|nr:hypothetical protein RJ55_02815 [Drechmeria coniospora]
MAEHNSRDRAPSAPGTCRRSPPARDWQQLSRSAACGIRVTVADLAVDMPVHAETIGYGVVAARAEQKTALNDTGLDFEHRRTSDFHELAWNMKRLLHECTCWESLVLEPLVRPAEGVALIPNL